MKIIFSLLVFLVSQGLLAGYGPYIESVSRQSFIDTGDCKLCKGGPVVHQVTVTFAYKSCMKLSSEDFTVNVEDGNDLTSDKLITINFDRKSFVDCMALPIWHYYSYSTQEFSQDDVLIFTNNLLVKPEKN